MVLAIGLTGCESKSDFSNTYNPKTDYQYFYHAQGGLQHIAATESGYYFLNGNYIYYADKASMKPVLLNNRPEEDYLSEEKTEEENNSAYTRGSFLAVYGDKLYTIQVGELSLGDDGTRTQKIELIESSEDGSKRKKILTFDFQPFSLAIHRGMVYYTSKDFSKESEAEYKVMRYNLKKLFSKPETIYTGDLKNGNIQGILPYGKNVYFTETGQNMYRTMKYDIEDKKVVRLFSDDNSVSCTVLAIFNNRLIFSEFRGNPDDEKARILYSSDLEGKNIEELPIKRDFLSMGYSDGKYLFIRPAWFYLRDDKYKHIPDEITIYDSQYQVAGKIDSSLYKGLLYTVASDDNYVFVYYGKGDMHYIDYVDKKAIERGELTFKNLIKTPDEWGKTENQE